jgi:hypothetical protein
MTYASMRYVCSPSSGLKDSTCYPAFSIAPAMNPHTMCFCQPIFAMISEMVCAVLALEHRDHLGGLGTLARPGSLLHLGDRLALRRGLGRAYRRS